MNIIEEEWKRLEKLADGRKIYCWGGGNIFLFLGIITERNG